MYVQAASLARLRVRRGRAVLVCLATTSLSARSVRVRRHTLPIRLDTPEGTTRSSGQEEQPIDTGPRARSLSSAGNLPAAEAAPYISRAVSRPAGHRRYVCPIGHAFPQAGPGSHCEESGSGGGSLVTESTRTHPVHRDGTGIRAPTRLHGTPSADDCGAYSGALGCCAGIVICNEV